MKPVSPSKRLLITGITGFSGMHMEYYFHSNGFEVFGITENEPQAQNHYRCDLRERESLVNLVTTVQPTHVIHMAAISFVGESNASRIYDVNVVGTCNLLEALLKLKATPKKVILASSATVYGNQSSEILDESMCPKPVNHYGCSKLAMEQMASQYMEKLPIIITRPFNYTGPGQAKHFLIPKIVSHFKQKKAQIELGNLHVEREFNDIRDICQMYGRLLESRIEGKTINLCSGRGIALLNVIEIMNEIAGYDIEVNVNPAFIRPNEIKCLVGSTEQLISITGELPLHEIRATLQFMYASDQ